MVSWAFKNILFASLDSQAGEELLRNVVRCLGGLQGLAGFNSEEVGVDFGQEDWAGILLPFWNVP